MLWLRKVRRTVFTPLWMLAAFGWKELWPENKIKTTDTVLCR
jgi:hypothetical protein